MTPTPTTGSAPRAKRGVRASSRGRRHTPPLNLRRGVYQVTKPVGTIGNSRATGTKVEKCKKLLITMEDILHVPDL